MPNYIFSSKIDYAPFSTRQIEYINKALWSKFSVAEGAVRSGKTIIHCLIFATLLEDTKDKFHLASGSTLANAKLNIGECNGFGLEHLFRGRCKWVKVKDNDALRIITLRGEERFVIFSGGGKADSYKKILGNSYGGWIATEINEHYDGDNPKESFIKVAFDRQIASRNPFILWDLNPSHPKHKIYTEYIDKYLHGYVGGYNYQLFTIKDNRSITAQRYREIVSQYDPKSLWFKRNILGQRCVSEGLCLPMLSDNEEKYRIYPSDVEHFENGQLQHRGTAKISYNDIISIQFGIDFGGNKSGHSITCALILKNFKGVVFWRSEWIKAKGINVTTLIGKLCDFFNVVRNEFKGKPMTARCDSAEQTIINELYTHAKVSAIPVDIKNALKMPINDRIKQIDSMASKNCIWWVKGQADSSFDAEASCQWSNKEGHMIDERLDDGTTDIDSCDSTEYAIEEFRTYFMRVWEVKERNEFR